MFVETEEPFVFVFSIVVNYWSFVYMVEIVAHNLSTQRLPSDFNCSVSILVSTIYFDT
jgi:hypothetical protein